MPDTQPEGQTEKRAPRSLRKLAWAVIGGAVLVLVWVATLFLGSYLAEPGPPAKLSELKNAAVDPSAVSTESESIESGKESLAASGHTVTCAVVQVEHKKWTAAVQPGQDFGQVLLDDALKLNAGATCGLSVEEVRATPRGDVRLLVSMDTGGTITDGVLLTGDRAIGEKIVAAAKRSWRLDPPKVNGVPVKTKALAIVRIR